MKWHLEATGGRLPTPPDPDLTRRQQRIFQQLRAGNSPITRDFMFRIHKQDSPLCPECGEAAENVRHLLLDCQAWTRPRVDKWGIFVKPEDIFNDPKGLMEFLARIGRLDQGN